MPRPAWRGPAVLGAVVVVLGALAWFWSARGPVDPLADARAAYDRGEYPAAASAARDRLRDHRDDPDALRLLARASARLGRDETAMSVYSRLGEDAMQAEDLYLLASRLARLGQVEPAGDFLEKALALEPGHPGALADHARVLVARDGLAEAAEVARRLAEIPGQEARGAVLLGLVAEIKGDHQAAADSLRNALEADPELRSASLDPVSARVHLARDLLALGRADDALATLNDALALEPDHPEARWLRSRALLLDGRTAEAAAALADASAFGQDQPLAHEPAPFVGAAACAECHREIYDAQQSSHHATTFADVHGLDVLPLPLAPRPDPEAPEVSLAIQPAGDDRFAFEATRGGESARALIEFVFGSGDRGATPVGREPSGQYHEIRLSHYGDGSGWDLTTGHLDIPPGSDLAAYLGRALTLDVVRRCLECHTTDPYSAYKGEGPAARDHAIGCERCHGPGRSHVLAMRHAPDYPELAIAQPRLASAEQVTGLCARCHSPKGMTVERSDPKAIRFQGTTLTWSRCYTESRDSLSCTTCHDPHRDAVTSADYYEARCIACHSTAGSASPGPHADLAQDDATRPVDPPPDMTRTPCPVSPGKGCVACHMPTRTGLIPHTHFTDHFIRVHEPESDAEPSTR